MFTPALAFEVSHWRGCFIGQPILMDLFDKNGRHLWGCRTPACFANEALQEIRSLQTTVLQINGTHRQAKTNIWLQPNRGWECITLGLMVITKGT